jgi:hypothetical protein
LTQKFVCPHWLPGQRCKPYFYEHIGRRLFLAIVGATIAVATPALNCVKAVSAAPPEGAIVFSVFGWGILIFLTWIGAIVLAMHYEHDPWGSFVSSVGTPTLLIALITLPQLA